MSAPPGGAVRHTMGDTSTNGDEDSRLRVVSNDLLIFGNPRLIVMQICKWLN